MRVKTISDRDIVPRNEIISQQHCTIALSGNKHLLNRPLLELDTEESVIVQLDQESIKDILLNILGHLSQHEPVSIGSVATSVGDGGPSVPVVPEHECAHLRDEDTDHPVDDGDSRRHSQDHHPDPHETIDLLVDNVQRKNTQSIKILMKMLKYFQTFLNVSTCISPPIPIFLKVHLDTLGKTSSMGFQSNS